MWTITYNILDRDGTLHKNTKQVERLADFSLFNNAIHSGAASIVAVRDPLGRRHDRRAAMKQGF